MSARLVLAALLCAAVLSACSSTAPRSAAQSASEEAAARRPAPRVRPPLPARPGIPRPEPALGAPSDAAIASRALVRPLDASAPARGLAGRHVALWPSHGWYFEPRRGAWKWQRAHLFTTIEDVLPYAFVQPYLAPMLERAGAVVLMPRERDTQTDEIVLDADTRIEDRRGTITETGIWIPGTRGFRFRETLHAGQNPFSDGTDRVIETTRTSTARTDWTFDVRTPGEYAVTVAYTAGPRRATDARYTIQHAGGTSRVAVNQTISGGTWVRLGTFRFAPGRARVTLSNESDTPGRTVSADAVRLGGGMGSVERGGTTGGRPRWTEGARYYEQFAGFEPAVYAPEDVNDDYKDDYKGRGEWVNALLARGVPVDVSLALHTDAGLTTDGTAVGTLAIYSTRGAKGQTTFADGRSRTLNRDLATRVQTQVVTDVRSRYDPLWTLRPARNRNYSEAARPDVPALLLEMFSHQNLTDVRFALDPRFRFDVSRAVYKGVGRFLAAQNRTSFVVQPLAPRHLSALFDAGGNVLVRWRPEDDPLEPSARADRYVVYVRRGAGGWDGGRTVGRASALLPPPPPGEVLSVRVASLNDGGESAPSEVLAVGRSGAGEAPVLVVAGFDRIAGPESVETPLDRGIRGDAGVPDGVELSYVGRQTDFSPQSVYVNDDRPGNGASRGEAVGQPVAGNTHDFVAVHGRALLAAGRSFVSASDEAVEAGEVPLAGTVDLLLGEEKTTPAPGWRPTQAPDFEAIPDAMQRRLGAFVLGGGKLIVSGAHWATDTGRTPEGAGFLQEILGVRAVSANGAMAANQVDGRVEGPLLGGARVTFNTARSPDLYAVEMSDGIEAVGDGALALEYTRTAAGAAVVRRGRTVALAFPVEALNSEVDRNAVMATALAAVE